MISFQIFWPTGCVQAANLVGCTTVPSNFPLPSDSIAIWPPVNDQIPSMLDVAAAVATPTVSSRMVAAIAESSEVRRLGRGEVFWVLGIAL